MNFSKYNFVCVPNFERLILVLIERRTVNKSDELAQVMFPICSAQVQIVFHAVGQHKLMGGGNKREASRT